MTALYTAAARQPSGRRAGYLLGFAMGGFFDGILLHQILQWHHLLSSIQTGPLGSLRMQVTVDGWFHALMYLVAALGLWHLWRDSTTSHGRVSTTRGLWPAFWVGFGVWHMVDAVFSHWITGIHRIRMDSDVPLVWDLMWFVVFGVVPALFGWWKQSNDKDGGKPHAPGPGPLRGLIGLVLAAGLANLFPLRGNNDTTVVALSQGASAVEFFDTLEKNQARIVWAGADDVWVVKGLSGAARLQLYRAGAVYVSGTAAPSGCAAWIDSTPVSPSVI